MGGCLGTLPARLALPKKYTCRQGHTPRDPLYSALMNVQDDFARFFLFV